MKPRQVFPGHEKLKSTKAIQSLFKQGNSWHKYPVRIVWLVAEGSDFPMKAAFTVPRRQYKRAVDRNLLKRRMREAYRKNKEDYVQQLAQKGIYLNLMFIYTGKEINEYDRIEKSILLLLKGMTKQVLRGDSHEKK